MRRAAIILLAILVLLPLLAVLGGGVLLNAAPVRARLADAVLRATGHQLALEGPIGLRWSLAPTIEARDVALRNPPAADGHSFSRPNLAAAARLEARISLWPLLLGRIEIPSITLEGADVLLERDAQGRGNWLPPAEDRPPAPLANPAVPASRRPVTIERLRIDNGTIAWQGGPKIGIAHLVAAPAGGPIEGALSLDTVPILLKGEFKPTGELLLSAVGGGLELAVSGQAAGPLAVQAHAPDLATVAPLIGRPLPPLRDVQLTGTWSGRELAGLHLTAGPSDLGATLPGLQLGGLKLDAPAADQPATLAAFGLLRSLSFTITAQAGNLSALFGPAPITVQAQIMADGASLAAQGTIGNPSARAIEATITARVPDLRRTGALAGIPLPALTNALFAARVQPGPGNSLLARGLRLSSGQGDLAGDLAFNFAPRPSVRGTLVSQRLDFDAAAAPTSTATPPPPPGPATPEAAPAPQPTTAAPPPRLPFDRLRAADADVRLTVGQLVLHGAEYRALEARLLLQDGRLRLDPARMQAPGGPIQAQLLADAADSSASVLLRAPGLDAATFATALGAPDTLTGTLDIDLQLQGHGADARAMAATIEGHAGLALVDGDVENAALMALFGPALRAANLPIDSAGRSRVRCFALRADALAGQVTLRALALDAARLRLDGDGAIDLVHETLDLHLRPTIRIGSAGVAIPVRLTGPIAAPKPAMERGAIAPGRVGISIGGTAPDPCGPALAAARDGRPGPLPR